MRRLIYPLLFVLLAGCAGYTLGPIQPTFMKGVHRVAVPVFRNTTVAADVEALSTTTVIQQIQQDGTYEVTGADHADAIVEGTISSVQRTRARALVGNVLASSEFSLTVIIHVRVVRPNSGELLGQRDVYGTSSFFTGNDISAQERQALPLAIQDAAVQLVSYLSEGW
jgi:Lipopolysaccharide-assembly